MTQRYNHRYGGPARSERFDGRVGPGQALPADSAEGRMLDERIRTT